MQITKYKKQSNGKYKVILDNNEELLLYEDVILKYELLLKKEITRADIIKIEKYNQECDVYHIAVKSLNNRYKTVKELEKFLIKKEYPQPLVEKTKLILIKQGYLNDEKFTKSYINTQIMTTTKGPYRISNELITKGIQQEIINREILIYDEEKQRDKIEKISKKMLKSNKSRGGFVLKNKISTYLINQGYQKELINTVLSTIEFSDNENIAQKEYEKLYRKLSRKYQGKELEYKIKEKLYQKGLTYEN